MSIPGAANPLLLASTSTAYTVSRSVRLNAPDSAYFSRTPASAGNRKTWTWAGWVKRSELGTFQRIISNGDSGLTSGFFFQFNDTNTITLFDYTSSVAVWSITTSQVFRDVSSWYHIALAYDTTQATASERIKLYINGGQVTAFSSASYPSQNYDGYWNGLVSGNTLHTIGRTGSSASFYLSGYLADIHFIDGQALTPSSFTEVDATTGQLIPKKYTGTFTGNSFWLPFSDNSSTTSGSNVGIGKDFSGLGNYWNTTNLSVTAGAGNDSLTDTPTSYGTDTGAGGEVRGNYATFSPITVSSQGLATLSNGSLDISGTGSSFTGCVSTIAMASGKYYWEYTVNSVGGNNGTGMIATTALNQASGPSNGYATSSDSYWRGLSAKFNGATVVTGLTQAVNGDTYRVAVDLTSGKIWFGLNNAWDSSGDPVSGANPSFTFAIGDKSYYACAQGYNAWSGSANFGQRPFAYAAPSGFKALCDTNLPAPVVAKSASAFDVKLYTGNGSTQTISGLGFSPDLVWIKSRSQTNYYNILTDSVRGTNKQLFSNDTLAEESRTDRLTAFNSDGFSLGSYPDVNQSSGSHVAWCWDAGTTTTTINANAYSAGVPSITSSVRANASAGFSIVTYTGTGSATTVGHGLGVAPALVIVKRRNSTGNWVVWNSVIAASNAANCLFLDATDAAGAYSTNFNSTSPTSTVFTVGTNAATNGNGGTYVAYCFAPVVGYSSMSSFVGNGSSDGVFVYTGFRPRWVLVKRTDATGDWVLKDTAREPSNVSTLALYPNLSNAENSGFTDVDYCSNGFKLRNTGAGMNANGGTYVYVAFAESPFQYARAR